MTPREKVLRQQCYDKGRSVGLWDAVEIAQEHETKPAGRISELIRAEALHSDKAAKTDLTTADATPDAPVVPAMRGDIEPCLRTDSERHELFPRLEALSKRLYQTQGLILSALASAGLTVVPLEPTAREVEPDPSMKLTSSLTPVPSRAELIELMCKAVNISFDDNCIHRESDLAAVIGDVLDALIKAGVVRT